jgi:hypothetical protein
MQPARLGAARMGDHNIRAFPGKQRGDRLAY